MGPEGIDYLGMKVMYFQEKRTMVDDMKVYVLKIQNIPIPAHKGQVPH